MEANLTHPRFSIELEYLLDANVLGNPIHSEGLFKGKFGKIRKELSKYITYFNAVIIIVASSCKIQLQIRI